MSLGLGRRMLGGGPAHCTLEFDNSRDDESVTKILEADEHQTAVFLQALRAHKLEGWLHKPGFTFLAPTNAAFRQLQKDYRSTFSSLEEMLAAPAFDKVLQYHILGEVVERARLLDAHDVDYSHLDTVSNNTVFRGCDEGVYFIGGGSKKRCHVTLNLVAADKCNVYVLDRVLLPNHSPL